MAKQRSRKNKIADEEVRRLVIERLRTLPTGKQIAIGSSGTYTKDQLIEAVETDDDIGKRIIEVELEFLRSFKERGIYDEESISRN